MPPTSSPGSFIPVTAAAVMVGSYDFRLVTLSVFISFLGAYAAVELAERISASRGRAWLWWVIGGAAASGLGTWSMHYTGMLSFSLPVPVLYDWPTVVISFLPAAGSGAVPLHYTGHGGDAIRGDVPLFSSTRRPFGNTRDSVVADKAELPLSG